VEDQLGELFLGTTSLWLKGSVFLVAWCAGLIIIMRIGYSRMRRLSQPARTHLDHLILGALSIPLVIIVLVSGGFILSRIVPHPQQWDKGFFLVIKVVVVLTGMLFADRLARAFIRHYSERIDFLRASSGVVYTAVRAVVILVALLVLLETFGVSITPLIASLGVGSLAVALALQSPLGNFFSGLQLVSAKPIEVGHYIKLNTGEEGYVSRIGWRSTTMRMLSNNMVIVPNSKIAEAIITNYNLPQKDVSVVVELGVHYRSDLDEVERVTCEVARQVIEEVPSGKKGFEPFIRYHSFSDSRIDFSVILRAEEFVGSYLVRHEFMKRLHKRYREEGIVIPFPTRSLDIRREDLMFLRQSSSS
jgi:small-conductance mechanosensitive channel